jgi:exonuclease VII small subunit
MRDNARRTRESLEKAGRRLEHVLGNYDDAQERLSTASAHYRRVMQVVDHIMDTSPVFQDPT